MMSLLDELAQPAWQKLGVALLHFLWQGVAISALVVASIHTLHLQRGRQRYLALLAAMILLLLTPVITYCVIDTPGGAVVMNSPHADRMRSARPPVDAQVADTNAPRRTSHMKDHNLPSDRSFDGARIIPESSVGEPSDPAARAMAAPGATEQTMEAPAPPLFSRWLDGMKPAMPFVVTTWLAGIAVLGLRLAMGTLGLWQLRLRSSPLPPTLARLVPGLVHRVGVRVESPVRVSAPARQPMAIGLFRPMVLLPLTMVTALPPAMISAIIAHELVHIRRHDQWITVLQRVIETLLFFHPAVWWVSRCLSQERELSCDAAVVAATGNPLCYGEALEAAARMNLAHATPDLAPGFGRRRTLLLERVKHLLGQSPSTSSSAWPAGIVALLAIALGAQLLIAVGTVDADDAAGPAADEALTIHVVDAQTGDAMPDVQLTIRRGGPEFEARTDQAGTYVLPRPDESIGFFSVAVEAAEYVPLRKVWRREGVALQWPEQHTFRLPRGTSIGGVIRNEQDEPIEGVIVRPSNWGAATVPPEAKTWGHEVTTDSQGHWRCDVMPPAFDKLTIGTSHPDYLGQSMNGWKPYSNDSEPSIRQFRDMTAEIVLKKGITISGRVLDAGGQPLVNQTVSYAKLGLADPSPMTRTDSSGAFRFQVEPGALYVAILAPGHVPAFRNLTAGADTAPIEFRLKKGGVVRGRVVDGAGAPLRNAWVVMSAWQQLRHLDWKAYTDEDGRFMCDSAPHELAGFSVLKNGFMNDRDVVLAPSEDEYLITLHPELVVRGAVTDATSGEAIERFRLIPAIMWDRSEEPRFPQQSGEEVTGGEYLRVFNEARAGHAIRIEADGYVPAESRVFDDGEGNVTFDFALERGAGPSGIVRHTDGRPVVGAEVVLATHAYTRVFRSDTAEIDERTWVESDKEGRFSFRPQTRPYALAAVHHDGYAIAMAEQIERGDPLVLEPWARVEGVFKIGDEPAPNRNLALYSYPGSPNDETPRFSFDQSTTADETGRFVFEHIRAGLGRVQHNILQAAGLSGPIQSASFDAEPGETVRITLGGHGRTVVGRLRLPPGAADDVVLSYSTSALKLDVYQPFPFPESWETMDRDEQGEWLHEWVDSGREREYSRERYSAMRSHHFAINPDGSFRVLDVPPGPYVLEVELKDTSVDRPPPGRTIGKLEYPFTMPELTPEDRDLPLDIGEHKVPVQNRLRAGDIAPDFECTTLDGGTFRLADHRGKFVLLDFWATWCGPCLKETPNLRETFEAYRDDDRFVMVGLSLDRKPNKPADYVAANGANWTQGFLGEWSSTDVPATYGVHGIPAIVLIGPDGRVVATELRGRSIKATVAVFLDAQGVPSKYSTELRSIE